MDQSRIGPLLLQELKIRVGPAMAAYIARRLAEAKDDPSQPIPVMGGDARTGVPVRRLVDPRVLLEHIQS